MDGKSCGLQPLLDAHQTGSLYVRTESNAGANFSLSSLFLTVGWFCVLLALGKVTIELAVILAALSLPAFARTLWLTEEYQRHGRRTSGTLKAAFFISSVGVILAAIAVGVGALFAACFGFIAVLATLTEVFPYDPVWGLVFLAMIPGLGGALAIGIWSGAQVEKLFRPSFCRPRPQVNSAKPAQFARLPDYG